MSESVSSAATPPAVAFHPLRVAGDKITDLDIRLQLLAAWRQHGRRKPSTASTVADEVAVIAKVTDVDAFEALSEVTPGVVIGEPAADGTSLVTARIPVSRAAAIRGQEFVLSLKAARRLSPALAATTEEIGARPADLADVAPSSNGGAGVVVAIIDSGGDFAHRNFRHADGTTRLLKLWDQNASGVGEPGFAYGKVHLPAELNAALATADPYADIDYPVRANAHGTHVMDIAAGNGNGTGVAGVAPNADLLFVDVANSDIPWSGQEVVGTSFGDSVQLLEALAYAFAGAGDRPCVANISLGTNGGPHDGSTLVEQGIDRLLNQSPRRAVCVAAANSFDDGIHAAGSVPSGGTHDVAWIVGTGDGSQNEFELWYQGGAQLGVELVTPDGHSIGVVTPGESGTVTRDEQVLLFVANRLDDPNNHDNTIGIFMLAGAGVGSWTVRLHNGGSEAVDFHAWIERDDSGQSTFAQPLDNSFTLGSISTGHDTIAVGSYDAHKAANPLSWFSSAGPTRDGRRKPEVSAPGTDVLAAASRSGNGVTRKSGTSMASPAVAGSVALLLAEAEARGRALTCAQIRDAVLASARHDPPPEPGWHDRYGHGRVSVPGMIASLDAPREG